MTAHRVRRPSDTVVRRTRPHGLALVVHKALAPNAVSPLSVMRQKCPERDRGGPSAFAACPLDPEDRPARAARNFTMTTLSGWGLDALVDDVAVVTTELVTNAVRYGLAGAQEPPGPQSVWMGLLRQGATVLCAVFDPGTGVPLVKGPDHLAESGRGMNVVEALSGAWGWTAPDQSGKAVWAMFSITATPEAFRTAPGPP